MAENKSINKTLKKRKANQASQGVGKSFDPETINESRFEGDDQQEVEDKAGDGGQTSGKSFDKHPQKRKSA